MLLAYAADLDVDDGGSDDAADAARPSWQAGRDVNALALNERDGELAVAAGSAVRVYDVETRTELFVFQAAGVAWGVALGSAFEHGLWRDACPGDKLDLVVPAEGGCDAPWPEWDSDKARRATMERRSKTFRGLASLDVGATPSEADADGDETWEPSLSQSQGGGSQSQEGGAGRDGEAVVLDACVLRIAEGDSSRTAVLSIAEGLDRGAVLSWDSALVALCGLCAFLEAKGDMTFGAYAAVDL